MNGRETRYELRVNIAIEKKEKHPGGDYWSPTNERLSVEENHTLDVTDFVGVMQVLGAMHDAVKQIGHKTGESRDKIQDG